MFSLVLGSRFFDEVLFSAKLSILRVVFCIVLDEVTDGGGMGIFLGILSAPVFGGAVLALRFCLVYKWVYWGGEGYCNYKIKLRCYRFVRKTLEKLFENFSKTMRIFFDWKQAKN